MRNIKDEILRCVFNSGPLDDSQIAISKLILNDEILNDKKRKQAIRELVAENKLNKRYEKRTGAIVYSFNYSN